MPPKKFKFAATKQKRRICSHLANADQGGQKNRNEKMIVVLYRYVFY
jgi:hypothetical protein